MLNNVNLVGRLVEGYDSKNEFITSTGSKAISFNLVTGSANFPVYLKIYIFNKELVETFCKKAEKGYLVSINGYLKSSRYVDNSGYEKNYLSICAKDINYLMKSQKNNDEKITDDSQMSNLNYSIEQIKNDNIEVLINNKFDFEKESE